MFASQRVLIGVAHQLGFSVADTKTMVFERYLAIGAIAHYVACLITAHWPELAGYAMSGSNLIFTCVVAFRWRLRGYVPMSLSAR